jgi:hypothetical protein
MQSHARLRKLKDFIQYYELNSQPEQGFRIYVYVVFYSFSFTT